MRRDCVLAVYEHAPKGRCALKSRPKLEPDFRPVLESEAEFYIAAACFRTGPCGAIGLEIERIVHDVADPKRPVPVAEVRAVAGDAGKALPRGGVITYEPGGQLEVSTACAPGLAALVKDVRTDLAAIDERIMDAGLSFSPVALDGLRPPVRTLELPRYEAMEEYYERSGPAGLTMMCSTASLQVCVDAGCDGTGTGSAVQRWRRLHDLAPVLIATFANSPFRFGVPSGWHSARQGVWLATDRSRAAPVPPSDDPRSAWARYALDAFVLCIPSNDGSWQVPRGLTMRDWLRGEGPRPATLRDVDYHLTTLFPHVRPRGFLELRVVDAQAGNDWEAVAAMTAALVDDERAADLAADACAPLASLPNPVATAARDGLTDPVLAAAALSCAEAALGALDRLGADGETTSRTEEFVERYTARGRCPADDRVELWHRTGSYFDPTVGGQLP